MSPRGLLAACLLASLLAGCGDRPRRAASSVAAALLEGARPVGRGARFRPTVPARPVPACRRRLGTRVGVHLELFARDRVVLVPAGIGVGRPLRVEGGRVTAARCYGAAVTLDPTGTVLVRPSAQPTVGSLFAQWGVPLGSGRLASFSMPRAIVRAYVDGRRRRGDPRGIPLRQHAEIVLELGPFVAPHAAYVFPAGL